MTSALTSSPSFLSLAAAGLYGVVVLLCLMAASTAGRRRQKRWHMIAWLLLALLFTGLALLRLYGVEEALRDDLRAVLFADGVYEERRKYQRPIAATVVALLALGVFAWIAHGFRHVRGRRNAAILVALASAFAMVGLIALRLVSLSPVDALLYGPAKLNWIVDLGSALGVLASAGIYFAVVSRSR